MLEQFDRPMLGVTLEAMGGAVLSEKVHQGSRHLLGSPPGLVPFLGMPVAAIDGEEPLQLHRQLTAGGRPGLGRSAPCGGSGR
ncbi:hypothetical protein BBFGKLBO_02609 [Synechococcus sp. CBW1107]|nr:hypothetical protein BBFGKLBO_02609 [Synechococcus sp. CBW1107]